jgi:hypothetical protein
VTTRPGSGSLAEGVLRLHWLDVQRHIYAHSAHGFAMSIPGGWEAFLWQRDARRVALVCSTRFPRFEPLKRFIDSPTLEGYDVLVELDTDELDETLAAHGFEPDYLLPGHLIPTTGPLTYTGVPAACELREVADPDTLADFAHVQDQAYRATYDWPKGCASLFYTDPGSLIGPDSLAAVLYLPDGRPVRTAAVIHKRGIVAGVAGAAVPYIRGKHLGEPLIEHLRRRARELWGAEFVHHITMPCAAPIAARLGLEHVTTYYRWSRAC